MNKIDSLVKDIQALQDYLDYRTEQERYAITLMSLMEYEKAEKVLRDLDKVSLKDFL